MTDLISEEQMADALRCPLMKPESPLLRKSFITGISTLDWALERRQAGDWAELSAIREKYTAYWKMVYYPGYKDQTPPPDSPFWEGPRKARSVAKRISDFTRKYTPTIIEYPYTLILANGYKICGTVTVVRRNGESKRQFILMPMEFVTRYAAYPDAVQMARWLWVYQTHGETIDIYFLPLFRGKAWTAPAMKVNTVKSYLNSMTSQIAVLAKSSLRDTKFPIPGTHCQRCVDKPCLEIYGR